MREFPDIIYRQIGDIELRLDLFLPDDAKSVPLILYIHGGAWMEGTRKWCGMKEKTEQGYAVAGLDYRLTTTAPFPACIEDCKYALYFLRRNAEKYSIDASRVCVAGDSAGGHLATLMGVTVGHDEWEPKGADCSVQAVIDLYGPTSFKEFLTIDLHGEHNILDQLLGVPFVSPKGLMAAATASPISYIKGNEPPFLIIHGDKDDVVPISQSYLLRNKLEKYNQSVAMHTVFGGGHGFNSPAVTSVVDAFLEFHFNRKN